VKKLACCFLVIFLSLPVLVSAQNGKDQPVLTQQEGEMLDKAEYMFDQKEYARALPIYLQLSDKFPADAYFKYKAGICYLHKSDEKEKSITYLVSADSIDGSLPDIGYYLGRAYHLNYKFDDAISFLNDYLKKNPKSKLAPLATRYVEHSNNGKILVNPDLEVEVEITNIGPTVNTTSGEYVPVISADQSILIFTYRGVKSTGGLQDLKFRPDPDGIYYEDVFISKVVEGNWVTPMAIGPNINTNMHDAAIALSPDGTKLFIFKSTTKDKGDIYMSTLNGMEWSVPVRLGSTINTKYWEGSVSITADGQTLYFASERPGGLGARDLYKSTRLPNGEWGKAVNLGPTINTVYNDDAPFIHPDGITLFFSSEGHNSIGGYDIMYSVKKGDTTWTPPTNLGYPVNTTEDELYYVLTADGETGYFSSNRTGGFGAEDIYTVIPGFQGEKPILALVFGYVTVNSKPVNSTITISDPETGEVKTVTQSNSSTGKYIIALTPGSNYKVAFEYDGMIPKIDYVNVKKLDTYVQIQNDVQLNPIGSKLPPGDSLLLEKKIFDQVEKYKSETKVEYCESKVYNDLLKTQGSKETEGITYRVELGTWESSTDFKSDLIKDLGTIESIKDVFNNTTFFFGGIRTFAEADKLKNLALSKDTSLKNIIVTVIENGKRRQFTDYYAAEYEKAGCKPEIKAPVVITKTGIVGLTDDKQYLDIIRDNGMKEIEGVSFKVEIGAVTDTNDFKFGHLSKYGKIEMKKYADGIYRYSFGPFKTLKESEDFKNMLTQKEPDASGSFITVFVFGERKVLDGPCAPDPSLDFAWFIDKDLNDTAVYHKLIKMGGNFCVEGLIFKVQIGAYRFPKNFKYPQMSEFGSAEIIDYPDGITRFTMKTFKTLREAEQFRQTAIQRGITDAWVTAVYKGERRLLTDLIKVNFYNKTIN
jgi:hypothetical protein